MERRIIRLILLFFIFLLTAGVTYPQNFTPDRREILKLQDTRSLGSQRQLVGYLQSADTFTVKCALIALGNIADSTSVDDIAAVLKNSPSGNLRVYACFSLGEINSLHSAEVLTASLQTEQSSEVICAILDNLGRNGSASDLEQVCSYMSDNDDINGAIALSIGRFGARKIRSSTAIEKLNSLAGSIQNPDKLKYVAYAFNRSGDKTLLASSRSQLETLCGSTDKETSMWAYSALGRLGDDVYMKFIMDRFAAEGDWRVRVNMLLAAGNLKITDDNFNMDYLRLILHAATDNENPNVSLTAMDVIAKLFPGRNKEDNYLKEIKQQLEWVLIPGKAYDLQIKCAAVRTLSKLFKDDYKDELFSIFSQSENYDIKAEVVRSFSYMDSALVYRRLRDSISADVMRYNKLHPNKDGSMIGSDDLAKVYKAFVDCLAALDDRLDEENRNLVRLIFTEFMSSRNAAITDVCITNLQDTIYSKYFAETSNIIMFDYPDLTYPKDSDVMQMYIQAMGDMKIIAASEVLKANLNSESYDIAKASADALKKIDGKEHSSEIKPEKYRTDFDWDFLHSFEDFKTAAIITTAGTIKIRLLYEDAPFTAMNFVKLARKDYLDNTVFHRVVPNFVIQGGDPTGTGFSGPGYSLRSEFTPLSYETGIVGMASSGKDTEGSQFFITHSPQYHLDGKYTIFARVVDGMDAVNRIQIGDKIINIIFSAE